MAGAAVAALKEVAMAASNVMSPRIDPQLVLAHEFPEVIFEYNERDVALYALGVGATGKNAVDPIELPFVYHADGQTSIKVLPTFAVIYPTTLMNVLSSINGLHFNPKLLLHGEHYTEIHKTLPTCGRIRSSMRVSGLHDKGKAAIIEIEILSYDAETGNLLSLNRPTIFLRGAGGFSPNSSKFSYSKRSNKLKGATLQSTSLKSGSPDSVPDYVYDDQTRPAQALLYRLSGDYNKIHSDLGVATEAGFTRPILHGLCTLGYAVRAIIRGLCDGDPTKVQIFQGRFLSHVYPGEELTTDMWLDARKSSVTYVTKANGRSVLSGMISLRSAASAEKAGPARL